MINVMPINDILDHEEGTHCDCAPCIEFGDTGEMLVIHNSYDGREATEPDDGGTPGSWGVYQS